jgi:hypothetical protein
MPYIHESNIREPGKQNVGIEAMVRDQAVTPISAYHVNQIQSVEYFFPLIPKAPVIGWIHCQIVNL